MAEQICPAYPGQEGSKEVFHDGRPDSAHEAEVKKAGMGGESIAKEDANEGKHARDNGDNDEE